MTQSEVDRRIEESISFGFGVKLRQATEFRFLVGFERKLCDDSEVISAALEGPEEVGMLPRCGSENLALRCNDFVGDDIILFNEDMSDVIVPINRGNN